MGDTLFDDFHAAVVARIEKGPSGPKKRKDKASPADNDKAAEKTASTPEQISGDELPALPESKEATDLEVASEETEAPERQGKLILDATVAPQAIRYPTDLSLLNEARELTEKIIDHLYPHTDLKAKPRTYRKKARKAYLAIAKQKRPQPRHGAKASSNSCNTCAGISNTSKVCWNTGPKASPFLYPVGCCIAIGSPSTCMRSNGKCTAIAVIAVMTVLSVSANPMCAPLCGVSWTSRWNLAPSSVSA